MTLNANELYSEKTRGPAGRACPRMILPKKFKGVTGAPLLAHLTPVTYDESTDTWEVLNSPTSEVQTLNLGSASAGTFTISFDGETTAAIAYNATAATVQTALQNLSNVDQGDIIVTGGPLPATITLTFGGKLAAKNVPQISVDGSGLTGATVTIATSQGGVNPSGKNDIKGFVADVPGAQLHATDETLQNVIMEGDVWGPDVPLPSGMSQPTLDAALQKSMRSVGFNIMGLVKVR